MTALAARPSPPLADPATLAIALTLLMLTLWITTLPALLVETRTVNDISVWIKPLKFQASLALHFATLWLVLSLMTEAARTSLAMRIAMIAGGLAAVAEIFYIMLQSARGRGSHFELSTPVEAAAYSMMGLGAFTIVVAAGFIGWWLRRGARPDVGAGLKLGIVVGLPLATVLTLVTAFTLGGNNGHWVGGVRSDLGGLPIVGWSRTGGDLRVPHFFALHTMQALPLLGWLADRAAPTRARSMVLGGAVLAIVITAATFWQALAGMPFWR